MDGSRTRHQFEAVIQSDALDPRLKPSRAQDLLALEEGLYWTDSGKDHRGHPEFTSPTGSLPRRDGVTLPLTQKDLGLGC